MKDQSSTCELQGGTAVQRGLANVETDTSAAPVLRFKSGKAYLTQGEMATRAAAAADLQGALAVQVRYTETSAR